MSEQDLQLIERYVSGEMTPEEQATFEHRLRTDEPLRNELEAYRMAIYAIRQEKKDRLKKDLRTLDAAMDHERKRGKVIRVWWKLASAVAAGLAIFFYFKSTTSGIPQTLPADIREQVFADHFAPHRDESMNPNVRGSAADTTQLLRFQLAYWNTNYAGALMLFDSLSSEQKRNGQIRFIKANILLKENRMEEAVQILEILEQDQDFVYAEETKWLIALYYLRIGDVGKAGSLMHELKKSGSASMQDQAGRVLKQIQAASRK